jgi:hypothetical protein
MWPIDHMFRRINELLAENRMIYAKHLASEEELFAGLERRINELLEENRQLRERTHMTENELGLLLTMAYLLGGLLSTEGSVDTRNVADMLRYLKAVQADREARTKK